MSRILLTGATGYVGGRLLRSLERRGGPLRCLARRPEFLASRARSDTEIVQADCLDPSTLGAALDGVTTAYYLVRTAGAGPEREQERRAARYFGRAARSAGVRKIIYLGELGPPAHLPPSVADRQEVGEILRDFGVPVIELRSSIILGSGSASFEMCRALAEREPIMFPPRWVTTLAQPIAVQDVLAYLLACLDLPDESRIYEIGGADRASYADFIREYARQRGLKRWMVFMPIRGLWLSSLWIGLMTPVYAGVGRRLVEMADNPTVVWDETARRDLHVRPTGLEGAIRAAICNEEEVFAATRWSDALSMGRGVRHWGGVTFGTRLVDSRTAFVPASPTAAFDPIRRLGGEEGWYYANWLWRLRGFLDLLVGGVGLRRGRPDPEHPRVGDTLDFWRVEAYEPDRRLRLSAEMKLPGRAWLEYEVSGNSDGSVVRQTAIFDPRGLLGLLYWYGIYPIHARIFAGMLREVAARTKGIPR
jgi:uncharacterized protein YbjT (DUF2867 family)